MFSLFSVGLCLFKPWSGIRIAFSYRPGGRGSFATMEPQYDKRLYFGLRYKVTNRVEA